MDVREIMHARPHCVSEDTAIADAARMMEEFEVGALPVCGEDRLIGIVTDRDIVVRCLARGGEPRRDHVGAIMTPKPYSVGPDEPLERVEALMAGHLVRRIPVCESDGRLLGIVSQADLARHASHEEVGELLEAISA